MPKVPEKIFPLVPLELWWKGQAWVLVQRPSFGDRPSRRPQRSGVDPPLSSSRACLHMAFIANSIPFVFVSLGQFHTVRVPHVNWVRGIIARARHWSESGSWRACSMSVFTVLRVRLLSPAPFGHTPLVRLIPGHGGCGEVKGQSSWPLSPTMASSRGLEGPSHVLEAPSMGAGGTEFRLRGDDS